MHFVHVTKRITFCTVLKLGQFNHKYTWEVVRVSHINIFRWKFLLSAVNVVISVVLPFIVCKCWWIYESECTIIAERSSKSYCARCALAYAQMADTIYKCFYVCIRNCGNSFNHTWRTEIQADLRYANGTEPLYIFVAMKMVCMCERVCECMRKMWFTVQAQWPYLMWKLYPSFYIFKMDFIVCLCARFKFDTKTHFIQYVGWLARESNNRKNVNYFEHIKNRPLCHTKPHATMYAQSSNKSFGLYKYRCAINRACIAAMPSCNFISRTAWNECKLSYHK